MDKLNTKLKVSNLKRVKYCLVIVIMLHMMSCIPAPPQPIQPHNQVVDMQVPNNNMVVTEDQFIPSTPLIDDCEASSVGSREWTGVVYEIKFGREEPSGVSLGVDIHFPVTN